MATYVAKNTTYPTIGEVIHHVAIQSGLVSANKKDPLYAQLKPFVHEQKGKDFDGLEAVLDELQRRFCEYIAWPGIGEILFNCFRRFLDQYKSLILRGRAAAWGRERFIAEKLAPEFIAPYVATFLKLIDSPPMNVVDVNELIKSKAPLKIVIDYALSLESKSWNDLAEIYPGWPETYGGEEATHDVIDKRKTIDRWKNGKATPALPVCFEILHRLDLLKYSGIVFWVWLGRFLQKTDMRYRLVIAEAMGQDKKIPGVVEFSKRLTEENDSMARRHLSSDAAYVVNQLWNLLYFRTHRRLGDKALAESLLKESTRLCGKSILTDYYLSACEARYYVFCRDLNSALECYERAFQEGMYGDFQAETGVLLDWAIVAQRAGKTSMLKRVDSRIRLLGIYPSDMTPEAIVEARNQAFDKHFGPGVCFIEAFRPSS